MDDTTPDVPSDHLAAAADFLRDEGYDVTYPVPGVLHVTGRFQNPERIALRAVGRLGDNPGAVWAVGTTNDWALVGWSRPDLVTITQRGATPQRWRHRRIPTQLHPDAQAFLEGGASPYDIVTKPKHRPTAEAAAVLAGLGVADPVPPGWVPPPPPPPPPVPEPKPVRVRQPRAPRPKAEPKPAAPTVKVCPTCFMALPATGVCDTCG